MLFCCFFNVISHSFWVIFHFNCCCKICCNFELISQHFNIIVPYFKWLSRNRELLSHDSILLSQNNEITTEDFFFFFVLQGFHKDTVWKKSLENGIAFFHNAVWYHSTPLVRRLRVWSRIVILFKEFMFADKTNTIILFCQLQQIYENLAM